MTDEPTTETLLDSLLGQFCGRGWRGDPTALRLRSGIQGLIREAVRDAIWQDREQRHEEEIRPGQLITVDPKKAKDAIPD